MKVSIIGAAGTLGSCTAFSIATQGLADELVMIDLNQNLLMCQVADISTAATHLQDTVVRAGNDDDLCGSDVVIVAAGAPYKFITSRIQLLSDNAPLIRDIAKRIARFCTDAVVITATNPVDPLNYIMYLSSSLDRKRFIGYSFNDSVRFRAMVAKALGVKSTQVEGIVIGEHGEAQVMLFSSLRVDGQPISVSEDLKRNIRGEIPNILQSYENLKTGRTTGWTSAVGMATMVGAIGKDTRETIPCSAVLAGEYGCQGLSMSVPAILGRGGIQRILEWQLAPDEHEHLEHSIGTVKAAICMAEEMLEPGRH